MHKDRIAEWILRLVTTPERAATTAGDLMESSGHHGSLWFWSSILRTAVAMLWHAFAAHPARLLKVGFLGSLRAYLLANLVQLAAVAGSMMVFGGIHATLKPGEPLKWDVLLHGWVLWVYYFAIFGAPVLVQFRVGLWAARKVPGNEFTAGLVLVGITLIVGTSLNIAIVVLDGKGIKPPSGSWFYPEMVPLTFASNMAGLAAMLAGAISVRMRTHA